MIEIELPRTVLKLISTILEDINGQYDSTFHVTLFKMNSSSTEHYDGNTKIEMV